MKPYQSVPIEESGEPLVEIPDCFDRVTPHPYAVLGAPYGEKSPFYLRSGVIDRLCQAQKTLQQMKPGWSIQIFDAYRPVAVQKFMVDYTFGQVVADWGLDPAKLTDEQRQDALKQVYQFWAVPNFDLKMPPPHSTGAALDITLVDADGIAIDMGSEIDEISPRSHPHYFVGAAETDGFDQNRQLLHYVMRSAGFMRHYHEWWHFSWGDQLWAWLEMREQPTVALTAKYGRIL